MLKGKHDKFFLTYSKQIVSAFILTQNKAKEYDEYGKIANGNFE